MQEESYMFKYLNMGENLEFFSRNHFVYNYHELCILIALEVKKWNHEITVVVI